MQKKYSLSMKKVFQALCAILLFAPTIINAQDTVQYHNIEQSVIIYPAPVINTAFNTSSINLPLIQANIGNGSVNNLLEMMPSMITTSDAGTGIGYTYMRLRGVDQTRINTSLNGITLNDCESQGTWLCNLPDMGTYIEQVSVQRGGYTPIGSVSYGARLDFITRTPSEKAFAEIASSYGSFNTFHNTVAAGTGLIGKRFSAMATFSDVRSDGFIDRADAKLNSYFVTANYRLLNFKKNRDYGTLKFTFLHGTELTGLAWNGVGRDYLDSNRTYNSCGEYDTDDGETRYYADEKDHYRQSHYQLTYNTKFGQIGGKWSGKLNVGVHYTRGLGYYQQYKNNKKISNYGLQGLTVLLADSTWETYKKSDFVTQKYLDNHFYGMHADFHNYMILGEKGNQNIWWGIGGDVDNYNGKHYGNVIWAQPSHVADFPVDYQWYNGQGDKFQTKLYGYVGYNFKNLYLNGELQYRMIDYKINGTDDNMIDIAQNYLWNFVNPKLSISYYFRGQLNQSLNLTFSTANREPTRSDLIDGPKYSKPVPETLYDVELSYALSGKKFRFDANVYGMFYKDQLVLTGQINDVGAAIMTNVDKSYRVGLELAAAYKPVDFFRWNVNGCFSINKIINYTHYVENWDEGGTVATEMGNTPISFSPNVVIGNEFLFTPVTNFDISILTKFVSKQYLDNSGNNELVLDPYSFTNVRFSYNLPLKKCMRGIDFFFQINNIFNSKYESNGGVYSYYTSGNNYADTWYFPQAGINFIGGIKLKF